MARIGNGPPVGHLVLGSLISIICIAMSLMLVMVIIVAPGDEPLWASLLR